MQFPRLHPSLFAPIFARGRFLLHSSFYRIAQSWTLVFSAEIYRTTILNNILFFNASDCCKGLDIKNVSDAVAELDDDEKTTLVIGENGSNYKHPALFVTEPGLYGLIWNSHKPNATAFKRWLKHDVLPSIRKNGFYINLNDPWQMITIAKKIATVITNREVRANQEKTENAHGIADKLCKIFFRTRRDLEGHLVMEFKRDRDEVRAKAGIVQLPLFEDEEYR